VEGKIFVRLDHGKDLGNWELTVACNLTGKWILHWGVSRVDDVGRYGMPNKVFELAFIFILRYGVIVLCILHHGKS